MTTKSGTHRVTHVTQSVRSTRRLPHGSMVGRFNVTEVLGRGGAGIVCAAHDPVLDRRVAVKVLQPVFDGPAGAAHRARLLFEARAMARLSHPNVVTVFEAGTTPEGHLFVMMELVEGGTLRTWLAESARSWREILAKLCEAGRGLAAAHAAGIVHRDFKLDNVLVGVDGRPRVCDFGIAHWPGAAATERARSPIEGGPWDWAAHTGHDEVLGTPGYMAPEQYEGGPIDVGTDVFGFCAASFRALYDYPPFPTDDPVETMRAVHAGVIRAPPRGSSVPRWVHKQLVRGLHADSHRRPDLDEILTALGNRRGGTGWALLAGSLLAVAGAASVYVAGADAGATVTTEPVGLVAPPLAVASSASGVAIGPAQPGEDGWTLSPLDPVLHSAMPARRPGSSVRTPTATTGSARPSPQPSAGSKRSDPSAVL